MADYFPLKTIHDIAAAEQDDVVLAAGVSNVSGVVTLTDSSGSITVAALLAVTGGDVVGPASSLDSTIPLFDGLTGKLLKDSGVALAGLGAGDVVGPGSAIDSAIALYDGVTGKLIKDSGVLLSAFGPGDVVGPGSATDSAFVLFDGATGKLVKDSTILTSAFQLISAKGIANGYASLDANVAVVEPATKLRETGGATVLDITTIADGQVLSRSGTDIVGVAPGAGAGTARQEQLTTQVITGTDTAITDTLDNTPLDPTGVVLFFNSLKANQGAGLDYTISGTTITWLASSGTAKDMDTSDGISVHYRS